MKSEGENGLESEIQTLCKVHTLIIKRDLIKAPSTWLMTHIFVHTLDVFICALYHTISQRFAARLQGERDTGVPIGIPEIRVKS